VNEQWSRWHTYLTVVLLVAVVSFPWWHSHPVAADMPMHTAVAKAFVELVSGDTPSDYPYEIVIKVGPYQGAQYILALIVGILGPEYGAKSALSLYALLSVLGVGYLVGRINPSATWERLVGVPLALNYFFHWGFWPFLISLPVAYFAAGYALRVSHPMRVVASGSLLRLLVFLLHPVTAVILGVYDLLAVLLGISDTDRWKQPRRWRWITLCGYWLVPGFLAVLAFLLSESTKSFAGWGSITKQAIQLVRPFYITQHWWEGLVPFAGWLAVALAMAFMALRQRRWPGIGIAGAFLILVGIMFPREAFMGGWEIGARFVLVGAVVVTASWATAAVAAKRAVLLWIVVATVVNVVAGHWMWNRHSPSQERLVAALSLKTQEAIVTTDLERRANQPSVDFGRHAGVWAWCLGIAGDAYNDVASQRTFGPVRHRRLHLDADSADQNERVDILYHPYGTGGIDSLINGQLLYQDSIYTMYRIE